MFIDERYIENLLKRARACQDEERIEEILEKAANFNGLTHEEVAQLIVTEKQEYVERIFAIARQVKERIYGDRVVMFAPLYVSDYCKNQCVYCSYNCKHSFERHRLTMEEVRQEVQMLELMGHKRLALEAGEDDENCPITYILDCIETIYEMKVEAGEIRRVNVNIAATSVENYRKLKDAQIGTYILFQETYHRPTYEKMHLAGPKQDYVYHTTAFDRAMEAGIDDVGAGALFGLYDPYFEVLGLMIHNEHLKRKFGVGFHTISVPRICQADGALDMKYKYAVDDVMFLKLVAVLRLAVPFTGMILSTRETPEMRKQLIHLGISQISGGSSTGVGGYCVNRQPMVQFNTHDNRETLDINKWLMEEGLIPSFCTACYRNNRTGDRFMSLAKSGEIKNVCQPNALMTLWEYAQDYGDEAFRQRAKTLIEKELKKISNEKICQLTENHLQKINNGERDLWI